jgi:hypothetical protein
LPNAFDNLHPAHEPPITIHSQHQRQDVMEQVKKTDKYLIYRKQSGRYAVKDSSRKTWVNGDDKTAVLRAEGLIQAAQPKAPAAEPPGGDEAEAQTVSEDASEVEGSTEAGS